MSRKSSIHFKPVSNVRFAVSHSERTDLSEPAYLLPKEYQLANILIPDSLPENDLAALFIQQKSGMSRQAKTAGSSPFWEGVVVLPNTNGPEQTTNLKAWKKEYEAVTGHKVLHMSIHLDEGYIDTAGVPQYNPHAHVIVSRMDAKNRVIHLDRSKLAGVQDLTAKTLQMERGSTLDERKGYRGRTHIEHREFRKLADEKRVQLDVEKAETARMQKISQHWSDNDLDKIKALKKELAEAETEAKKVPELEATVSTQAEQIEQINERSRLDREALKASGIATQADYQALKKSKDEQIAQIKKEHEAELAAIGKAHAEALEGLKTELTEVPNLVATVASQADQIAQLQEKYKLDREEFKRLNAEAAAAGLAKVKSQKDYQDLKTTHLGDIAVIGKAHAEQLEGLKKELAEAETEAKKVPELVAQIDQLTPLLVAMPGVLAKLEIAQTEAARVPDLVATVTSQADQINQLTPLAAQVPKLEKDLTAAKSQITQQAEKLKTAQMVADQVPALKAANPPSPSTTSGERIQNMRERLQEASKRAIEAPKAPSHPIAPAAAEEALLEALKTPLVHPVIPSIQPTREADVPGPSFAARVAASWAGFVGWIKSLGAEQEPVGENTLHIGPVIHLDDFHAVQKTGRRYAVHVLDSLDRVPDADNPRVEIQYRGGVGVVKGNSPARDFPRQR